MTGFELARLSAAADGLPECDAKVAIRPDLLNLFLPVLRITGAMKEVCLEP